MIDYEFIRTELADILGFELADFNVDTSFKDHSNWDSLAKMSTIATIIEATGARVSDEDLAQVNTLQDIYDLVNAKSLVTE